MAKIVRAKSKPAYDLKALMAEEFVVTRDVSLQRYLSDLIWKHMEQCGYNRKQRGLWIEEALAGLILHDAKVFASPTGDKVQMANPRDNQLIRTKTGIRSALERNIRKLVRTLQFENPDIVGHYSYVVRAAVRHRMRHPELYPPHRDGEQMIHEAAGVNLDEPF